MARYSEEFKYSIIKRMMPPKNESVLSILLGHQNSASKDFGSVLEDFLWKNLFSAKPH
ncbi:hypothetical protein [Anaerosolibacter sp.]|uniref:hypothetical protein n=1 Tax=Anaerosolibacter sp. TaxID=1872527 RepID=UPI0039EF6797